MITAWRIFKNSWKHIGRNLWIGLATVFVFMTALVSVNVLLGANVMTARVISLLEERIDVTVTFQPQTPEAVLNQARFYLLSLPQTASISLVTADEALTQFKERNKGNAKVLEALNELDTNPLGGQLILKAKRSEDYAFLLSAVQNPQYAPFIKSSSYDDHKDAIAKIQIFGRNVRLVGAVLVALFALFGLLTAFNAIRVAIYTHREEIAIMRLVGASSTFIRGPFVLEGIWLAFLSVVSTAGLVFGSIQIIKPHLLSLFDGSDPGLIAFFYDQGLFVFSIQAVAITFLSALVSWIAAGRYIRK